MPIPLNSKDWYWFVGGDTTKVYSSARNVYVDTSDSDYQNWLQVSGTHPPSAVNESDIWYYVQSWQPWWIWDPTTGTCSVSAPSVYSKVQLQNYNMDVRDKRLNGGMVANGVPVYTDANGRAAAMDARGMARGNANYTCTWIGTDGNFYPLDATGVITMADQISTHGTACYSVYADTDGKIKSGAITTTGDIDVAYTGL